VTDVSEVSEEARTTLTAEVIVDSVAAAIPVISPDGRWVVWAVFRPGEDGKRVTERWLAPVGKDAIAVRVADGSAQVKLTRWSPDSAWLFYVADKELRRLRVTADGPAADAETVLRWRGEISGLAPLAGGRQIAVAAADELTDEDERRKTEHDDAMVWSERATSQHWRWHRLRLLDLASGDLSVVAALAGRHVTAIAARPDGGALAVASWDCPEDEPGAFSGRLHILDLADGTTADVARLGLEARSPVWWRSPDGWQVAWLANVPLTDASAVFAIAVPPGGTAIEGATADGTTADGATAGEPVDLTAGMSACPAELVQVADGAPIALFAEGLDTALYRLDPAGPSFTRVTGWPGAAVALSASADATAIALVASAADAPRDVWAGPPDGLVRVTDTRQELSGIALGAQERLRWQAPDGLVIDGLLILPPGRTRSNGPFPMVILIHGGPYSRWADELMASWWSWGQWLAAAGYAVFCPNPRGSQGHGQEFAALVARAVGQDEWTDTLAGLDALVADGVADPARLGIAGWSHGGFIAAWAVTHTGLFGAAVMGAGIADWGMQVGLGELGRAEASLAGSFGWEGPGPHRHDELSPISYATSVTTPVLILHGEDDANVPVGQAMYFHRALIAVGAEHDLVIYPREGHNFTERAHQIDVLERIRAWFDRWLGRPGGD
jgi:dipeptidyl aminopeptidase/acylaminoacyl peptidase